MPLTRSPPGSPPYGYARRRGVRGATQGLAQAQGYVLVCGTALEPPGGGVIRSNTTKSKKPRQVSLTDSEWSRVYGFMEQQDAFSASFTPDSALVSVDGSFMRLRRYLRLSAARATAADCLKPARSIRCGIRTRHGAWQTALTSRRLPQGLGTPTKRPR